MKSRNVEIFTGGFLKETNFKNRCRCKSAKNIPLETVILGPEQVAESCNVVTAHHAILPEGLQSAARVRRWRLSVHLLCDHLNNRRDEEELRWVTLTLLFQTSFERNVEKLTHKHIYTDKSCVLCAGLKAFTLRLQNPFECYNSCTYVI